jgi:hypothetical protein
MLLKKKAIFMDCSEARANEIQAFFKQHPFPKNERKIAQLMENTMRGNGKLFASGTENEAPESIRSVAPHPF